jgi:hypothetical protein
VCIVRVYIHIGNERLIEVFEFMGAAYSVRGGNANGCVTHVVCLC